MGEHDAPDSTGGWLERWKAAEPVRLYLGTVAAAVIVLAVAAGWITQELAVAIAGVVGAVLMLGVGWWPVRNTVYSPASVDSLLDQQHVVSYEHGAEDMLVRELGGPAPVPPTIQLPAQLTGPDTAPRDTLRACVFMDEHGRRCTLREHPRRLPHQLEDAAAE